MDTQIEEKESILTQFLKNKILICLLIIAIVLGLYLRFDNYGAEGYTSDDMNTIPASVFVYYPHDYFPGLVSTEPPLGNYIIGLGCMASGEDFSGVSKVKPLFFPDRSAYIGEAAKNAESYCWAPIYLFGILFLVGIIIFAFLFFTDIYSVTYFITFFIFFSEIISDSRKLKVDVILFTFVIFALAFLWLGYKTKKGLKSEKVYFFFAFTFLGLGGAMKFPIGVLIVFSFLLLFEKYKTETLLLLQKALERLDLKIFKNDIDKESINLDSLVKNSIIAIISSSFFLMLFFNFSIKNLKDTYHYMTSLNWSGVQSIGFSFPNFFRWLAELLASLNIFDLFVFIFSILILIRIILKKQKTKQEKFMLYFVVLCFLVITVLKSGIMVSLTRAMPFMIGSFILMGMAFSNEKYSLFNTFKIKKGYFLVFMTAYIILSFFTLYSAPFHHVYKNPLYCSIFSAECGTSLYGFTAKPTSMYLDSVLKEDETFLTTGIYNFYTRHNDDAFWWIFYSSFLKQTGKEPRLEDYLKSYKPEDRRVRYVHTDVSTEENPDDLKGLGIDIALLKRGYKPNQVIKIFDRDSAYIYDLDNLIKK